MRAIRSVRADGLSSPISIPALSCARARSSSAGVSPSAARRSSSAVELAELADLVGAGAGIEGDLAGVLEGAGLGEDRVAEPALLAQLLEQPRRHAAAERGRVDLRRIGRLVAHARAFEGHREVHLLEVALLAALAAGEAGRGHRSRRAAHQPAEERLGRGAQLVGIDGAGGGDDDPLGTVVLGDEAREIGAAEARDPLGGPEDRAPEGLAGIGRLLQPVEDDVVRGVERLADLLQDHPALDLDSGTSNSGFSTMSARISSPRPTSGSSTRA